MGYPCSGKTTYAMSSRFDGFEYITPTRFNGDEKQLKSHLSICLEKGKDVVIDADNLTQRDRAIYLDVFETHSKCELESSQYILECHCITATLSQIKENGCRRQSLGGDRLNKSKLIRSHNVIELPKQIEGFQVILTIPFEELTNINHVRKAIFFSCESVAKLVDPFDVQIFPDVNKILSEYFRQGYIFIGVANFSMVDSRKLHLNVMQNCLLAVIKQLAPPIEAIYYSDSHVKNHHESSLPNPYFAFKARDCYQVSLESSIMVGCTDVDQRFALNAGIGQFFNRDVFFQTN